MSIDLSSISDEELHLELERRQRAVRQARVEASYAAISRLKINGKTVKDFAVTYYDDSGVNPGEPGYDPHFGFYLMHDNDPHNIYHDFDYESPQPWWPLSTDGEGENCATDFVPETFIEQYENRYEFHGTPEEGVEVLKKCGFERIIQRVWDRESKS